MFCRKKAEKIRREGEGLHHASTSRIRQSFGRKKGDLHSRKMREEGVLAKGKRKEM